EKLQPLLLPILLDETQTHLFLKDQTVYLGVHLTEPLKDNVPPERFAMMEIPTKKHGGRFLKLPTVGNQRYVMFIDDVIRFCMAELFPGYKQQKAHAVKVSRDAELDLEDEAGNLMAKITKSLKKRETGYP